MLISFLKRSLFVAGAGMLSYAAFTILEAGFVQHYETVQFDGRLRIPGSQRDPEAGSPVGKLTIPSARISAIVLEGDDDSTLGIAAGHIPGTAFPGEAGNVGIAAHRDTFFRNLENVHGGDSVKLTTLNGVYEYRIVSTEVVDPDRTDVLKSSGRPTLTLVTCYPFHWIGPAPKRFIVRGHLVGVILPSA
jgi:sortase A